MECDSERRGLRLPRWFYWGLALLGAYILYRANEVLLPFVLSFVFAYIMDPFVDRIEKKGVKRTWAILRVFSLVFVTAVIFIIAIIPPVIKQIDQVENGIVAYYKDVYAEGEQEYLRQQEEKREKPGGDVTPVQPDEQGGNSTIPEPTPSTSPGVTPTPPGGTPVPGAGDTPASRTGLNSDNIDIIWLGLVKKHSYLKIVEQKFGNVEAIKKFLVERQEKIAGFTVKILGELSSRVLSSASNIILVVLLPLLTFYFLCIIDPLWDRILFLITDPEHKREVICIASEINVMLGNYLKGQITVSLIVGVTVATLSYLLSFFFHHHYSLLLGFITGITCIIPYFGALISCFAGIVIGLFTASVNPLFAALAIIIMLVLVNQTMDNFVTPRIVGEQVGLHPLWTLFALLTGGKLFGVAGMLIAVPIAATIKICLIRLFPRLVETIPEKEKELLEKEIFSSAALSVEEEHREEIAAETKQLQEKVTPAEPPRKAQDTATTESKSSAPETKPVADSEQKSEAASPATATPSGKDDAASTGSGAPSRNPQE